MTTEAFNNNYFCKATGGELDKLASWFAASKPYADDPQIKARRLVMTKAGLFPAR
jgi:hypothetical protein